MNYRNLGNSGLKISEIGLGGNTFGWTIDETASIAVVHHALEQGINYIDTADMYDRGKSEQFIGKAIRQRRHEVILASKFGRPMGDGHNQRGGSRYYVMQAIDASLKRLGTDYVDLYQMHQPDPSTPIEETLRALDDLVKSGKVRYIGTSNFSAWQLSEAIWTSRVNQLHTFITEQPRYNLLERGIEVELVPFCKKNNIGIIPWGPLAGGFLTGKYRRDVAAPADWHIPFTSHVYGNILTDENYRLIVKLEAFAVQRGHTLTELAIAWLLFKPWVCTIIAGVRDIHQLELNLKGADWKLTPEEISSIDAIVSGKG